MIRTIVVEDEEYSLEMMKMLIAGYIPSLEVVGTATSVPDGIREIEDKRPDLVLLDIELGDKRSFDILEAVKVRDFGVIFTTAFDHYAIKAIRYSAFDYLLKPVDLDELQGAVNRFAENLQNKENQAKQFDVLLEGLKSNTMPAKIMIPSKSGIVYIEVSQIKYIEADGSYCDIYFLNNKKFTSSKTMSELQEMLADNPMFVRSHKSFLVNLSCVKEFHHSGKTGYAELTDGSTVLVAFRKKADFIKMMDQYIRS